MITDSAICVCTSIILFSCDRKRGLYRMHVFAFDERNYAETFLDLTIFKMPCTAPNVMLPKNHTTFLHWDKIPTNWRSKSFQVAAKASIQCNGTIPN